MTTTNPCIVGMAAPQFTLDAVTPSLNSIRIGHKDFEDRWIILIFYPRDFSLVCPTELTGFSAEKEQFDQLNCELLGISIDSVDSHKEWLATPEQEGGVQGLRFPLASDPDGEVCKRFGLWREADELPNRGLFLIDPSQTLRYAVTHDLSVGRNVNEVLRTLNALQAGGLCPSNWKRADGVLDVASMLQPGRVLGHYRIERDLGQGGFGQVWQAIDIRLQRRVALKVISAQGEGSEEKLLEEARMAAGINHANVCTIYSADSIDSLPVIAMEFVEGGTLADAIEKGIDDQDFHRLGFEIASGLAAAHSKQIVHGDLKPANILLDSAGKPVIADFGLARAISSSEAKGEQSSKDKSEPSEAEQLTSESTSHDSLEMEETIELDFGSRHSTSTDSDFSNTGIITGTPAFMSPEQASGDPLNEFSDVFSLGLILAQMKTGQSLLKNLSPIDIVKALRKREFVESLPEKLPESIRDGFAELLAFDPENRPSAAEICTRLQHPYENT